MLTKPYRPKINFPSSLTEKIANIIGCMAILFSLIFIAWNWSSLPAQVPMHFNGIGEIDRWGSKYEMLLLPVINIALFIGLQIVENKPHLHNYPDRINEANVEQFYKISKKIINYTKNVCAILFAYITYEIVIMAQQERLLLNSTAFIVLIASLFIIIFAGIIKMARVQ